MYLVACENKPTARITLYHIKINTPELVKAFRLVFVPRCPSSSVFMGPSQFYNCSCGFSVPLDGFDRLSAEAIYAKRDESVFKVSCSDSVFWIMYFQLNPNDFRVFFALRARVASFSRCSVVK